MGKFPRMYVNDTTVRAEAGKTTRVKTIAMYEAQSEEELSFPSGAVLFVVSRVDDKWWKGVYEGKAGLVPASHVQDASQAAAGKELVGKKCRAIKTFVQDDPRKLAFKVGDAVFVPKPSDGEEWEGVSNSVVGRFPRSFVVDTAEVPEEEVAAMVAKAKEDPVEQAAMKKFEEVKVARAALLSGGDDEEDE